MAHVPTRSTRTQVDTMAAYGVPETAIAQTIGIDAKTLRKHYRDELDLGHVRANCAVAQSLFKKATGTGPQSVTACIFWLKTRAGWRDSATPVMGKKEFAARRAQAIYNGGDGESEWSKILRPDDDGATQ